MSFHIELPTELGQLVDNALDRVRNETNNDRPEFADESWSTKQADAFVDVIRSFLSGDSGKAGSSNHLVTVHVDQSALVQSDGRSGLPVQTVKRLCCDGHTIAIVEKDRWCFYRPDGIAVPRCGYHASDMTDGDVDEVTNSVNNPPRGGLLSDVDRLRYSAAPPT